MYCNSSSTLGLHTRFNLPCKTSVKKISLKKKGFVGFVSTWSLSLFLSVTKTKCLGEKIGIGQLNGASLPKHSQGP